MFNLILSSWIFFIPYFLICYMFVYFSILNLLLFLQTMGELLGLQSILERKKGPPWHRHYWLGPCHKRLAWNCCCPQISCFGCKMLKAAAKSCVEPLWNRCHNSYSLSQMGHESFRLSFPFEEMLDTLLRSLDRKLTKVVRKGHKTSRNHSCLLKNLSLQTGTF